MRNVVGSSSAAACVAVGSSSSEKSEWSNDQLRWDAKEQEYKAEALTCRFGGGCRQGLNCPYRHSQEEIENFADERDLRRRKLMIRCGFCARGECKFEGCCARALRIAAATKDLADADYESNTSADSAGGGSAPAGGGGSTYAPRATGGGRRAAVALRPVY